MNTYFTADTHFKHANIVKSSGRPFSDVAEMDAALLTNINARVKSDDMLWHLGDLAWGDPWPYLKHIKCRNINLILGNHDKLRLYDGLILTQYNRRGSIGYLAKSEDKTIKIYCGHVDTKFYDHKVTLSHYPHRSWNCSSHGAYHLHGHVHGMIKTRTETLWMWGLIQIIFVQFHGPKSKPI